MEWALVGCSLCCVQTKYSVLVAYWKSTQSQSQSQNNPPPNPKVQQTRPPDVTVVDSDEEVVEQVVPRKGKPSSKATQARSTAARTRGREKSQPLFLDSDEEVIQEGGDNVPVPKDDILTPGSPPVQPTARPPRRTTRGKKAAAAAVIDDDSDEGGTFKGFRGRKAKPRR
jgi:hypothetical protein